MRAIGIILAAEIQPHERTVGQEGDLQRCLLQEVIEASILP